MIKNIYKTKSKLFIVFLSLTVSWIVFGIISLSSINRINKFNKLSDSFLSISNNLSILSKQISEVTVAEHLDDAFFTSGENRVTTRFRTILKNTVHHLDSINEADYFFYHKDLSQQLTEAGSELQGTNDQFNELIDAIIEKGNLNDGLISEWNNQFRNLTDLSYQLNNFMLTDGLISMQETFAKYLENPNTAQINQITQLSEELKNISFEPDTTGMNQDMSFVEMEEGLTRISGLSNEILEKDIVIGYIHGGGLQNSINEQISSVNSTISDIANEINQDSVKARKSSRVVIVIFWLLFIGITVAIFYFLNISLLKPFDKVKKYAYQLSMGQTPEKINIPENDEIGELGAYLNKFSESLDVKSAFANKLGEGTIADDIDLLSDDDILGKSLLSLKEKMIIAKKDEEKREIENEKRRWINEGLAKFGDILRQNNDNMEQLTTNLITNLVKYLNATQGGIFLLNDENKDQVYLELTSAIAYNRRKFISKKIELGEGLVGTCAVEQNSILITEIPEEYLEITSGLGDANPSCILLVPLNLENETLGVVELASFNKFKDYEVEFVEKIGESIASTLTTVRVNERTAELLEQSQKQAAEMKEQEEEMRQNMEELQATQEEAARRESEISSILNAINSTSLVVEYDMNGYITQINDKFLKILDTQKVDIVGVHHSNFTSKNKSEKSYIDFWKSLEDGKSISTVEVIKLLNGKKLWLNQHYSPILNRDNKAYKVINIAIDITETKLKEQSLEKRDRDLARQFSEMEFLNTAINEAIIKCEFTGDGEIISANNNFAQMMGHPVKDLVNKKIHDFLSEEETQVFNSFWPKLASNKSYTEVIKKIQPDGKELYIMSSFTPVIDDEGKVYKVYYLGQDITEQKQKYGLLVEANKEIERLKKLINEK